MKISAIAHYAVDVVFESFLNTIIWMGLWARKRPPSLSRLDGQTVVITGGNKGIGRQVTRDVVSRGANRVIIGCRDVDSGNMLKDEISKDYNNASVVVKFLDLSSLESVNDFAKSLVNEEVQIDVLVNNAGQFLQERRTTSNGWEMMMTVNYFGHVLLTLRLLDKMKNTSHDPRVIFTASANYAVSSVDWNDVNWERRAFRWRGAYGQSKLAVLLFARELARREPKVRVYAIDPGLSLTGINPPAIRRLPRAFFRTNESAADNIVHAIVQEKGAYSADNNYLYDGKLKVPYYTGRDPRKQELLCMQTMSILNF